MAKSFIEEAEPELDYLLTITGVWETTVARVGENLSNLSVFLDGVGTTSADSDEDLPTLAADPISILCAICSVILVCLIVLKLNLRH